MTKFSEFLIELLTEKQIDASVYENYVIGILEEDTDESEKSETLTDIFASLIDESDVPATVKLIIDRWRASQTCPKKEETAADEQAKKEVNIAELMRLKETQITSSQQSSSSRQLTEEQRRIKEQILANYSQTPVASEELDDDDEAAQVVDEDDDLEKNTNKADVSKLAREKREQAKLESQQKKLKDKEDRARQKANREDKKKARQAAVTKGERRR